ncbi:MAG TPA: hypothetical protein VK524_25920 [Polyangiaceae bacterium]|nr:hypothetical protein [Polyangiaceae bacterium]
MWTMPASSGVTVATTGAAGAGAAGCALGAAGSAGGWGGAADGGSPGASLLPPPHPSELAHASAQQNPISRMAALIGSSGS